MKITINNKTVSFQKGETVLGIARRSGISIPNLCSLDLAANPAASCRMCIVEVEGNNRLLTSCTLEATEGMVVQTHTPRIQKARHNILELMLANHPDDCLVCGRMSNCELSALAQDLGVRQRRYTGLKKAHPIDVSSPAIVRDPNKCILCGRCVTVCNQIQHVGAIDFTGRGFKTRVDPAFHPGLNVSGCVYCGQCVLACPTGALMEKNSVDKVIAALDDPNALVVAQVAPAVPATMMEESKASSVNGTLETLAAALKTVGFDQVFDTAFAADLTIMEEVSELADRIQNKGPLPMFTSCSPGWIRFVELNHPDLIPNLSTCKSPQQMAGALINRLLPEKIDLAGRKIFNVSIMPCTAKKYEARELGDVDAVLTTRELTELLGRFGLKLDTFEEQTPLDEPLGQASGGGRLFGGTGGVMEAAIRTAHKVLTGEELPGSPKVKAARGLSNAKIFPLTIGENTFNFAVVSGLAEAASLVEKVRQGQCDLHFIEVMTCPGGCIGGGGQPYNSNPEAIKGRLRRLYEVDRKASLRGAHENEQVQALYREVLGKPLGEMSHHLLHRSYVDRSLKGKGKGDGGNA